jgi:hypothetical protein
VALVLRTFIVDPLKTALRRDRADSVHGPARVNFRFEEASYVGVEITIQSPVPGVLPVVLVAGTDFLDGTANTAMEVALSFFEAVERETQGLLRLRDPIDPLFNPYNDFRAIPGQAMFASSPGAWGDAITVEVNASANSGEIEVNDVASVGGHIENAFGGAGAKGTQALDNVLSGLAPTAVVSLTYSSLPSGEVQYALVTNE